MQKRVLLSVGLGLLTSITVGILEAYLPFSQTKMRIIDAASLPGAVVAGMLYPEGIHTGRGAPGFAYIAIVANFLVYGALWHTTLSVIQVLRRSQGPSKERS